MSLLDDLNDVTPDDGPTCRLCRYIGSIEDTPTREALIAASEGTIGERKLQDVLRRNSALVDGKLIGRETISRHRREGHRP